MSTTRHIEINNELMQRGPDGWYQLEKDAEARDVYIGEIMDAYAAYQSYYARVVDLVELGYYDGVVLENYTPEFIEDIYTDAYKYGHKFASYMAATKFYDVKGGYALMTDDKTTYLETYTDRVTICALYLADGDTHFAEDLMRSMMLGRTQPATPTFMNAGRARRGDMVSCFLLEMDDSLNSINYTISTAMQLSKIGGGVAINLSRLRGRGEAIKGVEGAAKGIMPVLKLLEDAFSYADQMGQRKGSGAGYYNIFGWDVEEFLESRRINADEKIRLKTLSIGLIVPSLFYELVANGGDMYVFGPESVKRATGAELADIHLDMFMYNEFIKHPAIKKRRIGTAQEMLQRIATTVLQSGYPYIMNKDVANNDHALAALGTVGMSNLCTEIFQLQEASTIGDYGEPDVIRRDISCNLASLNIYNVMQGNIRDDVAIAMRALTAVSDMSSVKNAPGVAKANRELHSVGLGAMNLHGYLAANGIAYDSKDARDFADVFFETVNYYSIEASMHIAIARGQTFEGFEHSTYADGSYFDRYLDEAPDRDISDKVVDLFCGAAYDFVPSREDWRRLRDAVMKRGLYHAYRMAIAPTQSISYVQNATSSVMPIVDQIEVRKQGDSTTYYPMPYMTASNYFYYKSAYKMDQRAVIDMVATIQRHVDQGISCILHVNSDITTRELGRYYAYAHHRKLKSLYYTRTNLLSVEECTSCAV